MRRNMGRGKNEKKNVPKLGPFNPKDYERPGLSEDEIYEIKEAFDLFDAEKTGIIDPKDLDEAMTSLGLDERSKPIHALVQEMKVHNEDGIDFEHFIELMTARFSERDTREDILKVFKLFDDGGEGYIDIMGLKKISKELGENMDENELIEMIERADTDGDNRVTFEDFYNIMTKKTFI